MGSEEGFLQTPRLWWRSADLFDGAGQTVASTSPARAAGEFEDTINKVAAGTMVFYVAEGHEEAKKLSLVKVDFAKRVGRVVDGPGVSRGLVALAAFNVFIEAKNLNSALSSQRGNWSLSAVKLATSALIDVTAASLKLSQVLGDQKSAIKGGTRLYKAAIRPLFDMKNWILIGNRLQTVGAQTLVRTVGLASFVSGAAGVGLSFWEMRLSLMNKDLDAATGHAIAMTGGLVFLASPLMSSLLSVPGWGWAILGMGMVLGGSLYAGRATDDSFEQLLKRGPLGISPDGAFSRTIEKEYYGQLISLLSPIRVTVKRYSEVYPDPELAAEYPPEPDDYVVTVQMLLNSRLKLFQERHAGLPTDPFKLVVQELAYASSSTYIPHSGANVSDVQLREIRPLRKVVARQSLPQHSAVRFLVRREVQNAKFDSYLYEETTFTRLRVGLQAVIETEVGPLVFPTPLFGNYQSFEIALHSAPPSKERALFDPFAQPESPYWYFTEVDA